MIVVSHFRKSALASLQNHQHYARRFGYRHVFCDATLVTDRAPLSHFYKYEYLLNVLSRARENEGVLLLSEDALIVGPVPIERLLGERDWLLGRTGDHALPQVDVQFWRNSSTGRAALQHVVLRSRLGGERLACESMLFSEFETLAHLVPVDGIYPVMGAGFNYEPRWSWVPTFSISIDDAPDAPEIKGVTPRFRDVLANHVNRCLASGTPYFDGAVDPVVASSERSTYGAGPGSRIAITTLYTPNIAVYGRIAERNFCRYCEAHGYTLYVHRDIPAEIDLNASGNWYKPWFLHAYLQHHDWVFWLDSDVLIADLTQRLEGLLEGRDCVLARGPLTRESWVCDVRNATLRCLLI